MPHPKVQALALLGGKPVRRIPFLSSVVVDGAEKRELLDTLKSREFSRFMGSPTEGIERVLRLKSREACAYNPQYFTFLGGRKVRKFEEKFAKFFGADYAVSVNSATSGLSTAVGALGLEPGDEIIMPCLSFNASATSVLAFNAVPRFVDVRAADLCLDPADIERKINSHTKAILVVHLLGFPADMDEILAIAKKHQLKVIEDCAQAPGTKYRGRYVGTLGDIGVFSLQETKNITTGEGGMILTQDPELAARCRLIRNHGESVADESWSDAALANNIGFNFRMTELSAALGVAQIDKLAKNNAVRNKNCAYLRKALKGLPGLSMPHPPAGIVFHVLPLFYDAAQTGVARLAVIHALRAEGIPVGTGYTKLMYENPIFLRKIAFGSKGFPFNIHDDAAPAARRGDCPVAEDLIYNKFIWFYHIHRPNSERDMKDVEKAFKKVFGQLDALKNWEPAGAKLGYKW